MIFVFVFFFYRFFFSRGLWWFSGSERWLVVGLDGLNRILPLCEMPVRRGHVAPPNSYIESLIRKFEAHSNLQSSFLFGMIIYLDYGRPLPTLKWPCSSSGSFYRENLCLCVCVCVNRNPKCDFLWILELFFFYYVCYFALALLVLVSGLLPFVCLRLPTVILKRCNVHGVVSSVIYETAPATRNRGQCHWAALHQIISAAKIFSWRCRIPWQLVETEGKLKGISGNRRQIDAVSFTIQCPSL